MTQFLATARGFGRLPPSQGKKIVDKHIERPVFQHKLQVSKSLEQLHVEIINLRHLGYQVQMRRNIYNEELFKISSYSGTVFEIEGVAEELNAEQSEIHYNARIDRRELSQRERMRIILSIFAYAALCSLIYSSGLFASSPLPLISLLVLGVWLLAARSVYLISHRDPFQAENEKALQALLNLEADFLASMNSEFTEQENKQLLHRHKVQEEEADAS
jgi:hypothetical protein